MTAPNEQPIRFADGTSICGLCEVEPVPVPGMLCAECQLVAEEWAGLGSCRPDECACTPEQDQEDARG